MTAVAFVRGVQDMLDGEQTHSINGNSLLSQGLYCYGRSINLGVSVRF